MEVPEPLPESSAEGGLDDGEVVEFTAIPQELRGGTVGQAFITNWDGDEVETGTWRDTIDAVTIGTQDLAVGTFAFVAGGAVIGGVLLLYIVKERKKIATQARRLSTVVRRGSQALRNSIRRSLGMSTDDKKKTEDNVSSSQIVKEFDGSGRQRQFLRDFLAYQDESDGDDGLAKEAALRSVARAKLQRTKTIAKLP